MEFSTLHLGLCKIFEEQAELLKTREDIEFVFSEMVETLNEKHGKKYVVFVVEEVK